MTAKIVKFPENGMTMVINRLTEYTVQHYAGLSDVPHMCVKVRHNNGFAWFGISIVAVDDRSSWSRNTESAIKKRFLEAMAQVIDLAEMDSDIGLLMQGIQNICTQRKRPVMFGADSNEFIQINSTNNIQIEIYRNDVKPDSTTYGGYFFSVEYNGNTYPTVMYHRGVILYNYITKEAAHELLQTELLSKFPEFFSDLDKLTIPFDEIIQLQRNRNRWSRVR